MPRWYERETTSDSAADRFLRKWRRENSDQKQKGAKMAIVKEFHVNVEIEYYEVDENNKEDERTWIESTQFRVKKKDGGDPLVTAFRPNIANDSFLDQLDEMRVVLSESYELLQGYQDVKKAFGDADAKGIKKY